jgi:hypothetical protein
MTSNPKLPRTLSKSPLNMPEDGDIESIVAFEVGTMAVSDSPLLGLLTFVTRDGHYDFMIDEQMANAIVQEVRTFLRGDSPQLPEDDD